MVSRLLVCLALLAAACEPPRSSLPEAPSPRPDPSATAAATPSAPPDCARPCRRPPRPVGSFDIAAAPEASGIAASRRNPGVLYVLDDGPGTTSLLVLRARNARILGRLEVQGLHSVDSEDLAVARCERDDPSTCVFIGDIGDNVRGRDSIEVFRVREPEIGRRAPATALPADRAVLRYPDAPHDAEALLADDGGALGIVTKAPGRAGRGAARLYVTPKFGDGVLQRAGRVRLPPPALPLAGGIVGNVVTGGDIAGPRVILRTYDALYEFHGPRDGRLRDFPAWPVTEQPAPAEPQGEAVAYGADGCSLYTVSEDSGDLTIIRCR